MSGHTWAAFQAVPTAAAPPPTTAIEPASASRRCASSIPAATWSVDSTSGRRQKPLLTPVAITSTSYGSSDVVPSGPVTDDRPGGQVEAGELTVHDPHPVEAAEPLEGVVVVAGPPLRPGEPQAELLAADQGGLGGDADDVVPLGEPDRGEDAGVAQAGDHHARTGHSGAHDRLGLPTAEY